MSVLAPDRALSGVLVASLLVCWDVPEGLAGLGR